MMHNVHYILTYLYNKSKLSLRKLCSNHLFFIQRSLARRSWFLLQRIEGFYKAASFGNLLVFLLTGRYDILIKLWHFSYV